PYLIAQALAPVDGIDGTITYLFDKQVETKPKEGENGFVDYRNLGFVRNVRAGTVIADITLPVDGVDGTNVKNTPIRHKIGVPVKVDKGENVGLTEDGTHLIVLADGNLKYSGRFSVETTFNLKGDVDASTGNLDFIGDIIIRGEVFEGFKVVSQKSVTIYENATGATIEANGNVVIKKGCINCKIISHGNVTVDFAESCVITCDGDLKGDAFVTSTVYCGGELTAQGRRGTLMGGQYTCLKNLLANSIGLKSYGETIVTVGDNAVMLNEKTECEKRLQNLETQILGCNQVALFLGEKKKAGVKLPPEREEMLATAEKQIIICNVEKEENEKRIADIMQYLETRQNLSITCKKELYPGTKITINDLVYQVNDKYQYCKIYLGEDGIKVETL
ncbi:MAG: FapA family protein, partial [Oscillospiraceae bacterium]